jgi:hypothetical protein
MVGEIDRSRLSDKRDRVPAATVRRFHRRCLERCQQPLISADVGFRTPLAETSNRTTVWDSMPHSDITQIAPAPRRRIPIGVYRGNLPSAVEKVVTDALTGISAPPRPPALLNQPRYDTASFWVSLGIWLNWRDASIKY